MLAFWDRVVSGVKYPRLANNHQNNQPIIEDIDHEDHRVLPPSRNMAPGDFRFLTMRESYRSNVRQTWLAVSANLLMWNRIVNADGAYAAQAIFLEYADLMFPRHGIGLAVAHLIKKIVMMGWNAYIEEVVNEYEANLPPAPAPAPAQAPAPPFVPDGAAW
jgi:hypothetical protein